MFQILACSDIGSCCSDYALANFLDIARRIVELIQLIAPILLIVFATIQLSQLVMNPEEKDGIKKVTNKFIAAAVIFMIPVLFNMSLGILPADWSVSSCWNQAKVMREISKETKQRYVALDESREVTKILIEDQYEKGDPVDTSKNNKSGNSGNSTNVSGSGGQKLVNIALGEVGNNEGDNSHHKYEAYTGLKDSDPWCAAFVSWCAGQAGYVDRGIIPKYVGCTWQYHTLIDAGGTEHLEGSGYNPVAGDIIFFGRASEKTHTGIVVSSDANYVYTVEGNTSCEGDSVSRCNGHDGVSKKSRTRPGNIYSYITPNYNK